MQSQSFVAFGKLGRVSASQEGNVRSDLVDGYGGACAVGFDLLPSCCAVSKSFPSAIFGVVGC